MGRITRFVGVDRFPPAPGRKLVKVIGLRVSESTRRTFAIHSAGGSLAAGDSPGSLKCFPIYDWRDEDVYRAISVKEWDYNHAYDAMHRLGLPTRRLRIAPPTLNSASLDGLNVAARAWPAWFDKVCRRLPGVRTAAMFGRRAVSPHRRLGESWRECYFRENVAEAPAWIAERARAVAVYYEHAHAVHATSPLPDVGGCETCTGGSSLASWRALAHAMWSGDPFCLKITAGSALEYVEPEFFRPGAGTWGGGRPSW